MNIHQNELYLDKSLYSTLSEILSYIDINEIFHCMYLDSWLSFINEL